MKAYKWSTGIGINLGIKFGGRGDDQFRDPAALTSGKKEQYPLNMRLGI
jgi:hypothetical protein